MNRSTALPALRLTPRDLAVVRAVHDYRVLRRDQVQRLLFPSKNTANQRLHLLAAHGYLARRRLAVEYGQGSAQALYLLAGRGATLLAAQQGLDPEDLSWRRAHNQVSSPFLEHTLMINDVRLAVETAAPRAGYAVEQWVREEELRAIADRVWIESEDRGHRQMTLVPDAYFRLADAGRRAAFFLEADRATETQGRWAHKVRAYLAYVRSGAYLRRYGRRCLRVLTVTTGPARRDNLLRTTARLCEPASRGLFWFATHDQVAAETVLQAPVWRLPGQEVPSVLLVPPSSVASPGLPRLLFSS
jgi:hypothetical protein